MMPSMVLRMVARAGATKHMKGTISMKFSAFFAILFAISAGGAAAAVAAPAPPADTLCPTAVPKLVAFKDASDSNDLPKIVDAARGAASAYERCLSDAQGNINVAVEPMINYDKTREAQFLVVAGRALLAEGNNPDGIQALKDARHLAVDVADWQPTSQAWNASNHTGNSAQRNTDRNGSRYQDIARQIRDAADEALARTQAAKPPETKPN